MATISHITLPDGTDYSIQATGIFYGEVDSTSTSTVFTATIPGITEYYDGLTVLLKNGVVTSAANFTININGLGAKGSYSNQATGNPITPTNPTRDTTIFNINYTMMFIYCSTLVSGGCWIGYRGYNSDTNTIAYQIRTNSTALKTTDRTRYYRILFSSADGTKWVPANTQYDNSATSTKTVNTRKINPFGRIVYLGNSTNYAADAVVAATALWHQYALALGYSFNRTGSALTLTSSKPVYVKCAPQTDGSAIMDSTTPIVQDLPSTEDGKIYIFLGMAYSATNIEMFYEHPVYYYKDGCIRIWTNAPTVSVPTASDANPQMDGTAAAGTSNNYSRADHVHPKATYTASEVGAVATNEVGAANGVVPLNASSKIDEAYLPSYVDDVVEGYYYNNKFYKESSHTTEITGEAGKIYIDLATDKTYRYGGTTYAELVSGSLVSISRDLTSGTKSATITVNGTDYDIYSVTNTDKNVAQSRSTSNESYAVLLRADTGTTGSTGESKFSSNFTVQPSTGNITAGKINNYTLAAACAKGVDTSITAGSSSINLPTSAAVASFVEEKGYITGMYIASYGSSTFAEVEEAYTVNKIVYCKASSNADPSTGLQGRMAFLAYVNINSNNNTVNEFEFQYYRSVSTHTEAQQGDQVFIYKLNRNTGWSVTTREASSKVAANNGLTTSYSSGTLTISHANSAITAQSTQAVYPISIDAYGHITGYGSAVTIPNIPAVGSSDNGKVLMVVNGVWTASDLPIYDGAVIPTANGVEF